MINEILKESLSTPKGKYSSKKIQVFVSFNLCVLLALADQFTIYKINIQVFTAFLCFSGINNGLSMVANYNKEVKPNESK